MCCWQPFSPRPLIGSTCRNVSNQSAVKIVPGCPWFLFPFTFLPLSDSFATDLQIDGGGADQEQRLAVPHVDVEAVEGQVAQEAALLARLEERIVHPKLQLKAWSPWRGRRAEESINGKLLTLDEIIVEPQSEINDCFTGLCWDSSYC